MTWIQRQPDIVKRVQVIHLVRDPRAIYASRRHLRWCKLDKTCGSIRTLCSQMRSDLDSFEELAGKIGKARTDRLRFEDLVADHINETVRLYAKLGLEYGQSVETYLEFHTKADSKDMKNPYSTKRNPRIVLHSWKKKLSRRRIISIQKTCNDVMRRLGYQFL
ncbi:hypothetical protein HPB48_010372 [Haemaphysalis longicornis]|uniref:Sulfotransferase domain-containing protein n=1 Tax=Haemaphysalis longicornis TaxID=44386 RepID=A0A9J6GAJ3_HAELO|nr:hypothetical protein HPB48_010372 [Haemaphysalis longicornis]